MHPVEWGWDFTLQMDLWKAREHRFLTDVSLAYKGRHYASYRALLSIRSLPLAQLLEKEAETAAQPGAVSVDRLLGDIDVGIPADAAAAFEAVVDFVCTDWLADLAAPETLVLCEMSKILQIPFLFSLAASRLLALSSDEPVWWPLATNALWVPPHTDFARMLYEHTADAPQHSLSPLKEETQQQQQQQQQPPPPPAKKLPFDHCVEIAQRHPAAALQSPYLCNLSIESLCALLAGDFLPCPLPPEHLEHLLLKATMFWIVRHPEHVHVLTLIKIPLLPAGALSAELKGLALAVSHELVEEGAKAPTPPLPPELAAASGGIAQTPGTVLWRLVQRKTARSQQGPPSPAPPAEPAARRFADEFPLMRERQRSAGEVQRAGAARVLADNPQQVQLQQQQQQPQPRRSSGGGGGSQQRARDGGGSSCGASQRSRRRSPPDSARTQAHPVHVPETVLQNDGRPPAQFHEYRHLVSKNPSVNLSTMLWETSLRPDCGSTSARGPGSQWRNPNAVT
ncbi:hypothetical protein DIPPA_29268 [Diplonema papillatum]|nr:hypothetical protein DIPPA_29268 [Diplonema papillatum]